ncbi:neural proliferation differentiation and control protein 1 isoform X4 [Rhinolophus ferrumequinum]|uniref:neural proliferation differentiation and control protein 1 isoform X4 n=1 Tax=Rhinolophus ferrumequinum TaxID=59479 RepID=UPI00140F95C8|nr:neural proliferation differentiation and control protein 1 isoform X4 [Rhinolophus ferrumequinum]
MATPVPPPSPRHLRLLRLLLSGLILGAALRGAAAGRPDVAACPGSLDCALKRRARCPPGAHVCGPCLQPFQEDHQGLCVPRMRQSPGHGPPQPRLEDEIDFLAQELAGQEAGRWGVTALPQPEAPHRLLEPATLGLSERGQGPDLGLHSTQGVPAPTPRTTLGSLVSSGPVHMSPLKAQGGRGDGLTLVFIVACSVAGVAALAVAALCWYRLQRDIRLTQKADYAAPQAPGSPATPGISPGDQRLAHSAEMYHYQHQRQQMRCLERHKEPPKEVDSASSDEENEDGDFTVYECPGLAPTGEMEVRNPLFDHSSLSAPLPPPPQ